MNPETQTPPIGTLYLDPETGVAYRLRSYGTDWRAQPFTGGATVPDYGVFTLIGGASATRLLPESAVEIWRPA